MAVEQSLAITLKAKLLRGLAEPARLSIVEALRDGEKTVSQLVEETGLSQPNTSAHLACLKDCALVSSRQEGRFVFYALADPRMEDLLCAVEDILRVNADQVYQCTRYNR